MSTVNVVNNLLSIGIDNKNFFNKSNSSYGIQHVKTLSPFVTAFGLGGGLGYSLTLRKAVSINRPFKQYQYGARNPAQVLTNNVSTLNSQQILGYGLVSSDLNGTGNVISV